MSFIDEDLTCFSQKPLAYFQPNFECKLACRYKLMKIYQHFAGHMTAMPIMVTHTLKIFFLGTTGPILMKLCMKHQRPKPFIIYANYDAWLTLTYFMAC